MIDIEAPVRPAAHAARPARHDLYRRPHAGLRACMCEALTAVARADPADPADLSALTLRMRELVAMFETHLHHENTLVHPAIEARRPGATAPIALDHEDHVQALARLAADVEAIRSATQDRRPDALSVLSRDLGAFVADNLVHMAAEERDNNAALWEAFTDEEILAIEARIIGSVPPAQMMGNLRWMVPALPPAERLAMMKRLRAVVPAPAFEAALAAIEPHLDDREWSKLAEGLAAA